MRALLAATLLISPMAWAAGEDQKPKSATFTIVAKPTQDDSRSERRIVVTGRGSADAADIEARANRGWLGVSVGQVSQALGVQLGTEKRGVLVLNVVEGSPADEAGFQSHDIILAINGNNVGPGVESLVDAISNRAPGERMTALVLREGNTIIVNATLGSRADQRAMAFEWKHELSPDAVVEDEVRTRGRFMFRSPEGQWIMRDLGDVANMHDLPENIKLMLPESGERTVKVFVENGETRVRTRVNRDGETIEVERVGDGDITVTRSSPSGETTTDVYATEDELLAADEEAHKVLQGVGGGVFHMKLGGLNDEAMQFDFDIDMDHDGQGVFHAFQLDGAEWTAQIEQSLQEAHEAYARAFEELNRLQGDAGSPAQLLPAPHMPGAPPVMHLRAMGKPRHTFEVRTDGTIEVKIRKGDSELVQLFRDEQDLAARDPELADKYRDLMDAGR